MTAFVSCPIAGFEEANKMAVTIYDVAQRARVGIGTVSRAINNSNQIKPRTKQIVMEVIEELGYTPHAMAQSLARRQTRTVAVIIPSVVLNDYPDFIQTIGIELREQNYDLILHLYEDAHSRDMLLQKALGERRCDGVIALHNQIDDNTAAQFNNLNVPLLLINNQHPQLDSVSVLYEDAGNIGTQYLLELGHEKIAFIGLENIHDQQKYTGFLNALQNENIVFDDHLYITPEVMTLEMSTMTDEQIGQAAMHYLMENFPNETTALFITNDALAMGVMNAIKETGLNIPDDFSMVSIGDSVAARFLNLTSIRVPIDKIASMAVERILQRIVDKNLDIHHATLSAEIIERNSTTRL